jgi:H+-transporting ATPase
VLEGKDGAANHPAKGPNISLAEDSTSRRGLTSEEARRRLEQFGPNATPEPKSHPLLGLLKKFWAPVPWMLELTVVLEIALGRFPEAVVIGILLLFNAALSLVQERRAQNALALLKQRLTVQARVLRDGRWQLLPAAALVPGDYVHIRMGDLVPADLRILDGQVLLDQSALTGESMPVEAQAQEPAYAGAVVKHGEASGDVTATGARTYFGKTAELVRRAKTVSHLEAVIFTIVRYLVMMDAALAVVLLAYSRAAHLPYSEMIPFTLILLVASVPVALPATFTLATALGSMELAKSGVLATRLSAIEEAAAMDVLCTDKTGTITENRLIVGTVRAFAPFSDDEVLRWGALASDEASQDPIDLAILNAARARNAPQAATKITGFVPFDPATKLSEAVVETGGQTIRVLKGAPRAVAARAAVTGGWQPAVEDLAKEGSRVLAVAAGPEGNLRMAGLLALEDPPRGDSKQLVSSLRGLGVRVVMVTGDGAQTARAIAAKVGISERTCTAKELDQTPAAAADGCDIFAEVFPEQKFNLVTALQRTGHVVGMTGDGVNDAPALKQAEVGIAVASATDVAKAAASLVLTSSGLTDMLSAVRVSRRIYQRMLTYTLNKIIKTVEIALFLSLGVILTRSFIITPLLIVLLLFTNDFVTMSIATDTVSYSQNPDRWRIGALMGAGLVLGICILALSFSIFLVARNWLGLPLAELQTLVFLTLVFTGQGTVYLVRERRHFWKSTPGKWLLLSSVMDITLVSLLAARGVWMAAVDPRLILAILVSCF